MASWCPTRSCSGGSSLSVTLSAGATRSAVLVSLMVAAFGCGPGSGDAADEHAVGGASDAQGSSVGAGPQSSAEGGSASRSSTTRATSAGGTRASASSSRDSTVGGVSARSTSDSGGASTRSATASVGGKSGVGGSSLAKGGTGSRTGTAPKGGSATGGSATGGSATGGTAAGGTSTKATTSIAGGEAGACSNDLARGLALQQIAVYQAVKIPVMLDGSEVSTASRKARVVSGRDAMVRVFVKTDAGFKARDLMARLTLIGQDQKATVYTDQRTISGSSSDGEPASTFQVAVPAKALAPTVRYSVEVVECSTQTGTPGAARFPTSGDLDLGVKTTGSLKIKVLPISYNNSLPDTSESALAGYATYMSAMYPITDISITVGATIKVTSLDWPAMLDQIMVQRSKDAPAKDVYYYGLLKPTSSFTSFRQTYCNPSCVTGISYLVETPNSYISDDARCGLGLGYANEASHETMAHEVGHLHGRKHAPCVTGGSIAEPDAKFPYSGGKLGSWGYDRADQTLIDPSKATDIMGYCDNQWISDYTYEGIATRVADLAAVVTTSVMTTLTPQRWLSLWVTDRGPRWGLPRPKATYPSGSVELATVYDHDGEPLMSIEVYRTRVSELGASLVMVPEPDPNWYSVEVNGSEPLAFTPLGM
jgi:hypothetical protein